MIVTGLRARSSSGRSGASATTAGSGGLARGRARRGASARRGAAGELKANINVTPLVDVVLVLLIIFMVVTPMLSKGVNVDLPVTQNHDKRSDDNRDIVVAITHLGEIYLGSDRVQLEGLGDAVAQERRRHPDKTIFLKGDARIEFAAARHVMEALHRAGIADVQLGTEEERK
ncbi:MAG TPA: biopolymer transporter ExbD [Polyangia bacterium]